MTRASELYSQYAFNVSPGPWHEGESALPGQAPQAPHVRLLAYYLPQFHPIAENDAWWGTGFTEWTNVTKCLPRYLGHRQPNLPADLGFYDLRGADVLRRQADLALRAGISGLCIHYYWFSGRTVLERPLQVLLSSPDIKVGFCLNWANENWTRRWDGADGDVLLRQNYDAADAAGFIRSILPALKDPRYIKVAGRPLLMVYRPELLPDARQWLSVWNQVLEAEGLPNLYVVLPLGFGNTDPRVFGFDAAAGFPPHNGGWELANRRDRLTLLDRSFAGKSAPYQQLSEVASRPASGEFMFFPGVAPRWDNEARKPGRGVGFFGSTPAKYGNWLESAGRVARQAVQPDERVVFINAWNEWAEGAYLEPDRHFGYAYLAETRRALDRVGQRDPPPRVEKHHPSRFCDPRPKIANLPTNMLGAVLRRLR